MKVLRLPILAAAAGLLMLPGCAAISSLSSPHYYQLDTGVESFPNQKKGTAVLLGPVSLAQYLKQPALLQRQSDNSLVVDSKALWTTDLSGEVNQVLLSRLSAQLNSSRLALYQDRSGFDPDVQLLVSITRLDSGPKQPAVLLAHWRLLDSNGKEQAANLVHLEAPHKGDTADQVRAQSLLLQQFAVGLGKAVQQFQRNQEALVSHDEAMKQQQQKRRERHKQAPSREQGPDREETPSPQTVRGTNILRF